MSFAHLSFETTRFRDDPAALEQNVNGIEGHALAAWLATRLREAGHAVTEPWPEDHGWDFDLRPAGGALHLVSCSLATDGDARPEGHVTISRVRSLTDRLAGRNKMTASDPVVVLCRDLLARSAEAGAVELDLA